MLPECSFYELDVDAGKAISLRLPAGWEILCVEGCVWLTEEAAGVDVWLTAGQSCRLGRHGRNVIEADKPSALRLCRPRSRLERTFGMGLEMLARWQLRATRGGAGRLVLSRHD